MRLPEEFKNQVLLKGIMSWPIRSCIFCKYELSYIFKGGVVKYDSGCNCMMGPNKISRRTWEDVANHYNIQTSPEVIKQMDKFWGFEESNKLHNHGHIYKMNATDPIPGIEVERDKVPELLQALKTARSKLMDIFGLFGGGRGPELNEVFDIINKAIETVDGPQP